MNLPRCLFACLLRSTLLTAGICAFNLASAQLCNSQLAIPTAQLAKAGVKKVTLHTIDRKTGKAKLNNVFEISKEGYVTAADALGFDHFTARSECTCSADSLKHYLKGYTITGDKKELSLEKEVEYNKDKALIRRMERTIGGVITTNSYWWDPAKPSFYNSSYCMTNMNTADTIRFALHLRAPEQQLDIERDWKEGIRTERKTIGYYKKGQWTHTDEFVNGKLVKTVKNEQKNKNLIGRDWEEENNNPLPYERVVHEETKQGLGPGDIAAELRPFFKPRSKKDLLKMVTYTQNKPFKEGKDDDHYDLFYPNGLLFADVYMPEARIYSYEYY